MSEARQERGARQIRAYARGKEGQIREASNVRFARLGRADARGKAGHMREGIQRT
jgi:hypothetical protein